jgi:hypothetical protein
MAALRFSSFGSSKHKTDRTAFISKLDAWRVLIPFTMDFRLALVITVLSAPVCVALYIQIRSSLEDIQQTPEELTFTPARAEPAAQEGQIFSKSVYPIDAFPGSRQFKTVYGTIHVFEWGPEDGEKVLLVHGLGTPCIALGDMAKELVRKGYRVMIYGKFSLCLV